MKLPEAKSVAAQQSHWTAEWHRSEPEAAEGADPLEELIREQHRANYELWHEEDKTRVPNAPDWLIAAVKRRIDKLNQQRNDLMERIDAELLERLPAMPAEAPLHSETPGMMIDRLSILALKEYHTEDETRRHAAGTAHTDANRQRLEVLRSQRADLVACLAEVLDACASGHRRFKLYKQLKMYNDPALNPEVYGAAAKTR